MLKDFDIYNKSLDSLPEGKLLINTINAHSYNVSRGDEEFKQALQGSDVLIPDGESIVKAIKWLMDEKIKRIAGWDLFVWEMNRLESRAKNQESRQEENEKEKAQAEAQAIGNTKEQKAQAEAQAMGNTKEQKAQAEAQAMGNTKECLVLK